MVTTDHKPLTCVLTNAKLDSTGHCWLADHNNFHIDIFYTPGKHNTNADVLTQMSSDSVQAFCKSMSEEEFHCLML